MKTSMLVTRAIWAVCGAAAALTSCAAAAFSEADTAQWTQVFGQFQAGPDVQAADVLANALASGAHAPEEWQAFFRHYHQTALFTPGVSGAWQYVLSQLEGGPHHAVARYVSALDAAEALAAVLPRAQAGASNEAYTSLTASLWWLSSLRGEWPAQERAALFDAIHERGKSAAAPIAGALITPGDGDAWKQAMTQLCLTLADYCDRKSSADRVRLTELVELPETCRHFWVKFGIFCFDEGRFTEPHRDSLDSLFSAVPADLHAVTAVFAVSDPATADHRPELTSAGQFVFVPVPAMAEMTSSELFPQNYDTPPAPLFTATAGQELMRAIQEVQFAKRPSLRARRDVILLRAGHSYERYLRQKSPRPEVFLESPDELLPSNAYMHFIDSTSTFRLALDLFRVAQKEAMDAFLLFEDVLSGGGSVSYMFRCDPAGRVSRTECSIRRSEVSGTAAATALDSRLVNPPEVLDPVTSIVLGGTDYVFELNAWGGVSVLTRQQ